MKQDIHLLSTTAASVTTTFSTSPTNNYYQTPRTAPVTSFTRFPFDPPRSPRSVRTYEKNHSLFTFDQNSTTTTIPSSSSQQSSTTTSNTTQNKTNKQINDSCENKENKKRNDNILIKNNNINNNLINKNNTNMNNKDDNDNVNNGTELTTLATFGGGDSMNRNNEMAEYNENYSSRRQNDDKQMVAMKNRHRAYNKKNPNTSDKVSKHHHQSQQQHHHKKINSAPATSKYQKQQQYDMTDFDTTMFPFDREAIDYDRIQRECFAVEEEMKFPFYYDDSSDDQSGGGPISSPSDRQQHHHLHQQKPSSRTKSESPNELFQQYAMLSQKEREKLPNERHRSKSKQRHPSESVFNSPKFDPKKIMRNLSKFDQIVNKFDHLPAKSGELLSLRH